MKGFKKYFGMFLIIAVFTTCCFALTGCNNQDSTTNEIKNENIYVVIEKENDEYKVFDVDFKNAKLTENSTAFDVLTYLKDKNAIEFQISDTLITHLEGLVTTSDYSSWVSVYTSDETKKDTSEYSTTINFMNYKVYSSNFGIKDLKVKKGDVLYFKQN